MSRLEYRKLSDSEISDRLKPHSDWKVEEGKLVREFEFKAYQEGLAFASFIGFLADRLDHHPDLFVGYRKVRISLSTHAVDGISPYDFELIRRIDEALGEGEVKS